MEDTSFGVYIFATVLALISVQVLGFQADDLLEGDVRLVGGETGIEGRAEVFHDGEWVSICFSAGPQHEWELPEGDVFCRQLGFTRGAALILNGAETLAKFGTGGGDTFLTNVDCAAAENPTDLLNCSSVEWGSSCDNNLGFAGVVCRIPGYVGCYRYDHPGFLLDHEITSEVMTLESCLEACTLTPGPFRYAGVRGEDCNCGDVTLPTVREDDHQCYEPCPGDDTQSCGAFQRTAIYDLDAMNDGHVEPHIIWPSWGRDYNAADDGRVWRVTIPTGYDYAVLYLLSFDLEDDDNIILRSEARQYGTTLRGFFNLDLPYRWITNTATWFEVETQLEPDTAGDEGFIIYYRFGMHCFASNLPAVEGGQWDLSREGVYYERECPLPICGEGYQAYSSAVCQLDGTWIGSGSCLKLPTTRRSLFPISESTTAGPTQPTTGPTQAPPITTPPPPPPPVTQPPPPPQTQPPPPVPTTTRPPPPQARTTSAPRPQPPPAACYLPNIDVDTGVLIGTGFRAVFYEGDTITHCCTHKSSDCVDLTCQFNSRWSYEAYLDRCPAAVCTLPETDENGSIGNTYGRAYFEDNTEISLCCIHSDYCLVLRCRTDGSWENGEELLNCPGPRPKDDGSKLPLWVIIVIIVASLLGLAIIVICLFVWCCWPQRRYYGDKRPLTYASRPQRGYPRDPPPYSIEPREGYRNPPPPRHLRKSNKYGPPPRQDSRHRSPSPSRRHHSPIRKDPVVITTPADLPKDVRDYTKYGPNPIIIAGSKYRREDERERDYRDQHHHHQHHDREHYDPQNYRDHHHHHHHHHDHQAHRGESQHRDRSDYRDRRDRRDRRSDRDQHEHRDRRDRRDRQNKRRSDHHRRSDKSHKRRESDEASALGVLNNVVQDLRGSSSDSDSGSSGSGNS